jgi:hypothetical protein
MVAEQIHRRFKPRDKVQAVVKIALWVCRIIRCAYGSGSQTGKVNMISECNASVRFPAFPEGVYLL